MVYPAGITKISLDGAMPDGTRFSFGFQTHGDASTPQARCDYALTTVRSNLQAGQLAAVLALMTPDTVIDTLRAYGYDGGARAVASSVVTVNIPGTSQSEQTPNQVALCVTLLTAQTGRRHRGRMYLPTTGPTLGAGQLSQNSTQNASDAVRTFLNSNWQDAGTGGPQTPCVASATAGTWAAITATRTDSRLDVIRHRAQGQRPNYTRTSVLS